MTYLEQQSQVAATNGLLWLHIKQFTLHALAYQALGEATQAQAMLTQALSLAEPEGYVRLFVDEGERLQFLILAFRFWLTQQSPAAQNNKLSVYVDKLLAAFGNLPTNAGERLLGEQAESQKPKPALSAAHGPKSQALVEPLTPRELEVLQLIAAGHSNREIARTLIVSLGTVKKHLSNIFGKLATESRTQTVARARELELL